MTEPKPGWCVPSDRERWWSLTPEQRDTEMREAAVEARRDGTGLMNVGGMLIPLPVPVPISELDGMIDIPLLDPDELRQSIETMQQDQPNDDPV